MSRPGTPNPGSPCGEAKGESEGESVVHSSQSLTVQFNERLWQERTACARYLWLQPDSLSDVGTSSLSLTAEDLESTGTSEGPALGVFLARDLETGKRVILKLVKSHEGQREARVLCALDDVESVPSLLQVLTWNDHLDVLVIEFRPGATLLEDDGGLTPSELLGYLIDVGEILSQAHQRYVFHRDVKADNVVVDHTTERASLIDWGIGRLCPPPERSEHSAAYQDWQRQVAQCRAHDLNLFYQLVGESLLGWEALPTQLWETQAGLIDELKTWYRRTQPPPLHGITRAEVGAADKLALSPYGDELLLEWLQELTALHRPWSDSYQKGSWARQPDAMERYWKWLTGPYYVARTCWHHPQAHWRRQARRFAWSALVGFVSVLGACVCLWSSLG